MHTIGCMRIAHNKKLSARIDFINSLHFILYFCQKLLQVMKILHFSLQSIFHATIVKNDGNDCYITIRLKIFRNYVIWNYFCQTIYFSQFKEAMNSVHTAIPTKLPQIDKVQCSLGIVKKLLRIKRIRIENWRPRPIETRG
jgi:hypothetical protein